VRIEALPMAIIGLPLFLVGCADRASEPSSALNKSGSHLTVLDDDKNVLPKEKVPAGGFTALDIVIRRGREDDVDGIFVQFNANTRFVPWVDLMANPLGQRIPSDGFVRGSELGLRLAEGSCGRSTPRLFQVRELRADARKFKTERTTNTRATGGHLSLEDLAYTTLSGWTESGLYTPEWTDLRWVDTSCQTRLDDARIRGIEQAPDRLGSVTPTASDPRAKAKTIVVASWQPANGLTKRHQGQEPGNIYDGNGR